MSASVQSGLAKLHNEYYNCVDNSLKNFLSGGASVSTEGGAKEWCTAEKNQYYEFLRNNFRTQYDNIIRLENQNF